MVGVEILKQLPNVNIHFRALSMYECRLATTNEVKEEDEI